MANDKEIAYCEHPLPASKKKELRNKGFKIIDAAFAPKGVKLAYEVEKPKKSDK